MDKPESGFQCGHRCELSGRPSIPHATRQAPDRHVKALLQCAWFTEFPPAAIAELAAHAQIVTLSDKEFLYRQGEPSQGIALILSGGICSNSITLDGREFTFSLLKPGAIVGLTASLDGRGMVNNAIAHGKAEVLKIPREALMALLQRTPALYSHFVQMLCYRLRKAFSIVDELVLVPVRQRLPWYICTLVFAEHGPDVREGEIELSITQYDLAGLLGVTRAVVNKVLKELEDDGLIATRYHKLVVRDFAGLHLLCARQQLFAY